MRRRDFLAALAGASFLLPVGAGAQQSTKVYRIAFLHPSHPVAEMTENSSLRYYRAFFEELRRLGYVEGQNVLIERFSGEGHVENYASLRRPQFRCCVRAYSVDCNTTKESDFYNPDSRS